MKLAVAGSSGRMGQMILAAAQACEDLHVVAALDRPGSPSLGQDCLAFLGRSSGVAVTDRLEALAHAEVLIDFTRPEATLRYLPACVAGRIGMVIGTTGFDAAGKAALEQASRSIAMVVAPNMSVGVQVLLRLVETGARLMGEQFDLEILEMHHRDKVDAPSGTALQIGEIAARARGRTLADCAVYARQGHTGPRAPGSIGFATLRGGDVIGEHTVLFAGAGERIEITHRSTSRQSYALGALRAARFLAGRAPGLYGMQDVLA
jgi:4-hydroxy-tetrahydrodipicolinate reductase